MAPVLVVDDDTDIREAVAEVLSEEGYQVLGAGDGEEALTKCRAYHPSVVLLDLMMPGMNGWEFRAEQKRDPELAGIPVVVLTALEPRVAIDAEGFIRKPFEVDELLAQVRRHAGRDPVAS
ncbi:MAG TPA: response regulator [Anaeromyxobacteraceae bacterium]|nr:response regulator [Anaeromyxobacteraceae bacterium]